MSRNILRHLKKVSFQIKRQKMASSQEYSFGVIADIQYADADDATDFR